MDFRADHAPAVLRARAKARGIGSLFAQMLENGVDGALLEDEGDDPHVACAAQKAQRIDVENALQELGPAAST